MDNNHLTRSRGGRDEDHDRLDAADFTGAASGSYRDSKTRLLHGLRRVEGQVRGIQRMVEDERYCVDVINQIAAAKTALVRLALIILEDHTSGCVSKAVAENERKKEIINELMDVVKKLV